MRIKLKTAASMIVWTFIIVAFLIVMTGVILSKFEPQANASHQTVEVLERSSSHVNNQNAARGEPFVQVQFSDGKTHRFPSLYYTLHVELRTACLRTSEGRFTGAMTKKLVPPENCA